MKRCRSLTLALLVAFTAAVPAAQAAITTVAGGVVQVAPPASAMFDAYQGLTIYAWDEQQGVTLASDLRIDANAPGVYDQLGDLLPGSPPTRMAIGTVVDSHMLHYDPPSGTQSFTGTVTFDADILGVIIRRAPLNDSDVLGTGTLYPTSGDRTLEFDTDDSFEIHAGMRTMSITMRSGGANDQVRVLTAHNEAPTASAGGPYGGTEGAPVSLTGTASDPEGDALTVAWSFTVDSADPGTACTPAGETTLTPTLTCTDDALVTATVVVDDGANAPVASSAAVTVGNAAPTAGVMDVPVGDVALGSPAAVSALFTDAGTNDTHTATITWGDTTSSAGTVAEMSGAGSASGSHVYSLPGIYTVTLTVDDDDSGTATTAGTVTVNGPPTADASGPYNGAEGSDVGLAGAAFDPEGDPLALAWTFTPSIGDPGTTCTSSDESTLTPSVSCDDDAVVAADLSVDDGVNAPTISSTTVTIDNEIPVLAAPSVTAGPIAVGDPVDIAAAFTDDGSNDTHVADVAWGDLTVSAGVVIESGGSGSLAASHAYASPGVYTITVTVVDDNLGSDVETVVVVVNSPPTADAGGPYVGLEGSSMGLAGTATDPDGDPLAISWSFTVDSADPGTVCTPTGDVTTTPTLTCTDDAMVTATMTVDDGVNLPVSDSTTLEVGNASPVIGSMTSSDSLIPVGGTVSVSALFSDIGANDAHSASIDWDDANTSAGAVAEAAGSGSASGSHTFTTSGLYTIEMSIEDDDGGSTSATVTVRVNGQPTVGSGGPYSGTEGNALTLNGSAGDADGDALTTSWVYTVDSSDPGATCSTTGDSTLTPAVTCDDDAVLTAVLTVDDGVNDPVVSSTTVTIGNAAPTIGAPAVSPNPTTEGVPVGLAVEFADLGGNDVHSASVDWGDAVSSAAGVAESGGSGTASAAHAYATSGTYTVTVTVVDDDGGTASATTTVVVNGAPTAGAGGPYFGVEGTAVALAGTATDPGGDALSASWTFTVDAADAGTVCTPAGETTLTPTLTCTDDASVTATLTVSDGVNVPATSSASVSVANSAPSVSAPVVTATPVPVGTAATASALFTDAGANDSHTASIAWADTTSSSGAVTESGGSGSVAGTHVYSDAGTYRVTVTVIDDDGGSGSATADAFIVIYDPSAGFVTGGGWINSPSGAYTPANVLDADITGKANFGFVSKYLPNSTTPSGSTEFNFKTGNLNFHSTSYDWLVVTSDATRATYVGTGRVNNVTGYSFVVSVVDGGKNANDRIRIKIWNTSTSSVLYDTQSGDPIDAAATLAISSGSIIIHS